MIAALSLNGVIADFVIEGGTSGDVFVAFVEQVLVPSLKVGSVVVLDNLGVHKRGEVKVLIEAAGCELVFLPAYFNPIESLFAWLKARLRSLRARSVEALQRAGVSEFVFVVGWRGEIYREWCARECSAAVCVENPAYATTGSLSSLLIGAAVAPERNLIVVESDLLYEQRAPDLLLSATDMDTVLISGFTRSRDEVWAYESAPNRLARLTKRREEEVGEPVGELVGLTRMSASLIRDLGTAARTMAATAHYEDGLNAVAAARAITLLPVPDLAWCEIDDPAHLVRARDAVWPRIVTADTAWNLKP